jgi:signal transduction histidine kinase
VLASWGGNQLLIRSGNGKIHRIELSIGQTLPLCGEHVSVIGDAETDLYHLNLSHAICRNQEAKHDDATQDIAKPVAPEAILDNEKGERKIQPSYSGQLIKIRGRATLPQSIICDTSHIYLNCGRHIVPVNISSLGEAHPDVPPDTLVEATGICLLNIANWRPNSAFPKIQGFTVIARSPGDIRIIAMPPWWTTGRLAAVIAVLAFGIAAVLAWNRSLSFLVDRRSRELLREQISHAGTVMKVDERTRLAVELHDSLSQNLAGVGCQIESMRCALSKDPSSMPERLAIAKRMLMSCRTELKRCLFDLRCEALEEGDLSKAVRTVLEPVIDDCEIAIRFNVPRRRLLDTTAHSIICIIRELASNAVRHGHASKILIAGDLTDGRLQFSVRDNGRGFSTESAPGPAEGHFGLQGVKDRVDRMGGTLQVESGKNGTYAKITVHLAKCQPKA